ncbi:MAG TPA: methyltransferase domain-containing protein [Rhizomicrobium sp.]|jgi:SAM-dependent methyltransferase|nr:methyltransferase domain-containing protein [Rhizomicrobium sp.]
MAANLSFAGAQSTKGFYSDIHRVMVDRSRKDALPPTSAEFATWLARRFGRSAAGLSALDCGCGLHTFNIRSCQRIGFARNEAIDANPDVVAELRGEVQNVQFRVGSVLEIPSSNDEFDLVICSGVAHHTSDPLRAFHEIARVMKPGAIAYISLYTFRLSLFDAFVRAIRVLSHIIPYGVARYVSRHSRILNNFVLDHMYVPLLWLYTAADARAEIARAGLTIEADFPSSFDVFCGRPLGRFISGDGLLRVFVCRKPPASAAMPDVPVS